ncbi:MAG: cob(I)yrinic acid a,c-diamide adenosyltransferase [Planctomycetales bacterium]|nr:cob(I)yrinic acid a,c-diamide adenosyltransferase [Planctomycetales bacterium]
MKIYTKTGDDGTTGLFAGPRVPKHHARIDAYGVVDELNALIGLISAELVLGLEGADVIFRLLSEIQRDLFSMGAQLATPNPDQHNMRILTVDNVTALEMQIDATEATLPALETFILPGGSKGSALFHLARTVCRRCERAVVHLACEENSLESLQLPIIYLNRLSDLFFVLARWHNRALGISDVPWCKP